jgi:1-acyl-sn-glycerol-3-phosphate acyltransferase
MTVTQQPQDQAKATAAPASKVGCDPTHTTWLWRAGRMLCRAFSWLWFDLKTYGKEHVPAEGGVLLIANHQSYLDPILVAVHLKRPVSFFAKSELFENRYFGWLIRNLHAFPVKQGAADVGAVKEAVARLKEGHVLNIYPEGSRSDDGELLPIQPGVALIVRKAGVPIVPVIIDGSFDAWPRTRKIPHPHRIKVLYGPPLQIDGLKGEAIVRLIDETFHKMFADVKKL